MVFSPKIMTAIRMGKNPKEPHTHFISFPRCSHVHVISTKCLLLGNYVSCLGYNIGVIHLLFSQYVSLGHLHNRFIPFFPILWDDEVNREIIKKLDSGDFGVFPQDLSLEIFLTLQASMRIEPWDQSHPLPSPWIYQISWTQTVLPALILSKFLNLQPKYSTVCLKKHV